MRSGGSRNDTAQSSASDPIVRSFDARTRRDRTFPLLRSPRWQITVGDLHDWSLQIAAEVAREALAPGALVGLSATGAAFVAAFLALRRSGSIVLLLDPSSPVTERDRVLMRLGARAVVSCDLGSDGRTPRTSITRLPGRAPEFPWREAAVVKLTSGSTGIPRGVAVTADALMADEDALARTMGFRDDDRLLAAVPMSHSYGFTTLALSAMLRGLPLVLPGDDGPFAPLVAARTCGATILPTVPAYLQAMLRVAHRPRWPESIRLCVSAGAPLAPSTASRFREATGRPVHVFYGSSECGGITFDRVGDAAERGTVGTPVAGVSVALEPTVNGDGGDVLVVESPAVALGYVPEPDSRLDGARFHTADLARWCGSEIVLVRRTDRVINVLGFKVDPTEVEDVIGTLPGVQEVAVLGMAANHDAASRLRAVVACSPGAIDAWRVAEWCRPRLADHKVPRSIVLVEALPRTARGKVDFSTLQAIDAEPVRTAPDD